MQSFKAKCSWKSLSGNYLYKSSTTRGPKQTEGHVESELLGSLFRSSGVDGWLSTLAETVFLKIMKKKNTRETGI